MPKSTFAEDAQVIRGMKMEDEREGGKQRVEGRVVENQATHNIMSA